LFAKLSVLKGPELPDLFLRPCFELGFFKHLQFGSAGDTPAMNGTFSGHPGVISRGNA